MQEKSSTEEMITRSFGIPLTDSEFAKINEKLKKSGLKKKMYIRKLILADLHLYVPSVN